MRTCVLCGLEPQKRAEIERDLANGRSLRSIAAECDCSKESVRRHRMNHVPGKIAKAAEKMEIRDGINAIDVLVDREKVVEDQIKRALAIDNEALSIKWTLKAIETGLKVTELNARLTGELNGPTTQVNLLNPEFIWLRDTVFNSLNPEDQLKLAAKLQAIKELEQ